MHPEKLGSVQWLFSEEKEPITSRTPNTNEPRKRAARLFLSVCTIGFKHNRYTIPDCGQELLLDKVRKANSKEPIELQHVCILLTRSWPQTLFWQKARKSFQEVLVQFLHSVHNMAPQSESYSHSLSSLIHDDKCWTCKAVGENFL